MAILMFVARIHDIQSRLFAKQQRLTEITRRISDLQEYAASIADGSVTLEEMMTVPGSMFGRMFQYMGNSHNQALMYSENQFNNPGFQQALGPQLQQMDPQAQQQYIAWIKHSMYSQAREQIGKQEARLLHQQEKKLVLEKEKLEASIKMDEADLKSSREARDKGIEQMAPKYVA